MSRVHTNNLGIPELSKKKQIFIFQKPPYGKSIMSKGINALLRKKIHRRLEVNEGKTK